LPLDTYSHWFETALPQASQRQRFFKERIVGKPISHANFRLAHLLSEKRLATLVVTPNFDDFLPRALTLFGVPHIVCDHPNTVERINAESDEIQIVHVHGTYWFYDGCNLRGEIEARTEDPRERSVTMTSLLGNICSRHSAIVIGYAGWEGDVIMTALKRRLQSRLPNNLYWFCYRRSDVDALPDWLKNHRDARFVLPPTPPSKPDSQPTPQAKLVSISSESEPTLTAQLVLDKLVGVFTEKSPALTLDPIGFFADQLKNSFPLDPSEKPGEDIYTLRDVIRRVQLARKAEKEPTPIEADIESVRDAVRRSAYQEAIEIAGSIAPRAVREGQREELVDLVLSAASRLGDNSEAELRAYETVLSFNDGDAGGPVSPRKVAGALLSKSGTLGQTGKADEALEAVNELLRRFGDDPDHDIRVRVGKGLLNKAIILQMLSRSEEAIQVCDELLSRFDETAEPDLRSEVADALHLKGTVLDKLNRSEQEIQTYDEVLRRFSDATEPRLREVVANALVSKGVTLGQLNHSEQAIQSYNEALRRFGEAAEPTVRESVATALVNKGATQSELKQSEEEIQTYDEVLRRFNDATEPAVRQQVAKALVYKGLTLKTLKRAQEARSSFQEVLKRFDDSPDGALQQRVEEAKAELKSLDEDQSVNPRAPQGAQTPP
jgi:tetratricopeptide (TPR) repeat protein